MYFYSLSFVVNADYEPNISPNTSTISLTDNTTCHSLPILDDMSVEPPETITITLTPTGPSQEYIDLFNIIVEETIIQIVDDDSKLRGSHLHF